CSVVFDDCVILHDVKVLNGEKGRYIIMPEKSNVKNVNSSNRNREGEDVFHPVRQSYSSYMKDVVLKGFEEYENGGNKVYNP
ncbi:septation protein SpoVG family protein, partial [Clostridium baratii]